MSTSSSSAIRAFPARGEHTANSPAAETLRRRLQGALPYGAAGRIAIRTGRPERAIYGQIEGEHGLTVTVAVEALREATEGLRAVVEARVRLDGPERRLAGSGR